MPSNGAGSLHRKRLVDSLLHRLWHNEMIGKAHHALPKFEQPLHWSHTGGLQEPPSCTPSLDSPLCPILVHSHIDKQSESQGTSTTCLWLLSPSSTILHSLANTQVNPLRHHTFANCFLYRTRVGSSALPFPIIKTCPNFLRAWASTTEDFLHSGRSSLSSCTS